MSDSLVLRDRSNGPFCTGAGAATGCGCDADPASSELQGAAQSSAVTINTRRANGRETRSIFMADKPTSSQLHSMHQRSDSGLVRIRTNRFLHPLRGDLHYAALPDRLAFPRDKTARA